MCGKTLAAKGQLNKIVSTLGFLPSSLWCIAEYEKQILELLFFNLKYIYILTFEFVLYLFTA